jgi:hypothetical protein
VKICYCYNFTCTGIKVENPDQQYCNLKDATKYTFITECKPSCEAAIKCGAKFLVNYLILHPTTKKVLANCNDVMLPAVCVPSTFPKAPCPNITVHVTKDPNPPKDPKNPIVSIGADAPDEVLVAICCIPMPSTGNASFPSTKDNTSGPIDPPVVK